MKRTQILAISVISILIALPAFARQGNGKNFLIHAKSSLKQDDAQLCAVPNVAWAALQEGYKVTILFDASSVTSLKKGGLLGGDKSPLDKASLPERERQSLSSQHGVPLESIPHDYGEYIRFLKAKGVELYANRTMMLLYKIKEDEIEKAATPVGLKKTAEIFTIADVYVAY